MKASVEKNKHKMCLAKAMPKSSSAYKKMSVVVPSNLLKQENV